MLNWIFDVFWPNLGQNKFFTYFLKFGSTQILFLTIFNCGPTSKKHFGQDLAKKHEKIMIWKLLGSAQNSKIWAIFIDFTNRTFHDLNVGQNYVSQLENDFPGQNINPAFISGHIWPRKLSLANMWPNWLSTKLQNVAKSEEFSSKSKKMLVTSIGVWPRVKSTQNHL